MREVLALSHLSRSNARGAQARGADARALSYDRAPRAPSKARSQESTNLGELVLEALEESLAKCRDEGAFEGRSIFRRPSASPSWEQFSSE